ncbi:MAG: transcriptional regulator [Amycolatopsis sp.]|uniref:ArsR/SmtB family transcription factor n=1 Tax=Amycolatopsis sp. TaxID=37632 RepID=UPI00262C74CD|nr:helix-turn-helix domain-containing protein [Amycolatopsis sp.]MCU1679688.1 transcriptional regulator [Amycolatopsis sp.]
MVERGVREIKDSKVLAAMSHPLRRRLLDVLKVHGPSTVSLLAERTGQAVGNVSHHLKVLAESELVEEVPELAKDRREHWWQRVSAGTRWSTLDFRDDPAAFAAESLDIEHDASMARAWLANRGSYRDEWLDSAYLVGRWVHLSPGELNELGQELIALYARFGDRDKLDDGQEREPVYLSAFGAPGQP